MLLFIYLFFDRCHKNECVATLGSYHILVLIKNVPLHFRSIRYRQHYWNYDLVSICMTAPLSYTLNILSL